MKDVFVVYGRRRWSEAVFDHDNRYCGEAQLCGVFETYDTALQAFKGCVREAHTYFIEHPPGALDEELVEDAAAADPFADYNMGNDSYAEGDVQWIYREREGHSASWQMYPVAVDTMTWEWPLLSGIYLEKQSVSP